ncbi:MAG: endolytic transglycosylase MltG [Dehalococcoidia bacterium]|nr:endolytic transglycosylase MltG [Dehalococcoidia bacterium]
MRTFFIILLLLILLALVAVSSAVIVRPELGERGVQILIDRYDRPRDPKGSTSLFSVVTGDTSGKIGEDLEKKGVIGNSTFFKLLVGYYGLDKSLKAGDYEVSSAMTMSEIISKLNQGLVKTTWVTIPEGLRLEEIANSLDQKGIFRKDDFLAALKGAYEYPFLRSRPAGASLDGYLFPDTYEITPKSTAADFVVQMLSDFQVKFTPAMMDSAARKGLTVHQVLALASIVEREAVVPAERPVIASVFLNRLDQKMPLYADPTVQYALGSDPALAARWGYWKAPLSQADLQISSPYNTYRNPGLPPGPIANPGLASIKAVLEPANTDYLYFVAKGDGSHAFAVTIEEHNRNVGKYQGGP